MSPSRVVAIGGGHGLATTLQAAMLYAADVTAVVSVADDGGSSGRLRASIGGPAPGDLRRCLAAMAPESLIADSLDHRFVTGELAGHAVGNILIAGLVEAAGDLVAVCRELSRLLDLPGRVLPATTEGVELVGTGPACAPAEVRGQVAVEETVGVRQVTLSPVDARTPAAVLEAIVGAEQIVIGPGSLLASVIAPCLPRETLAALAATKAPKIYVANLGSARDGVESLGVAGHVDLLMRHGITPNVVLIDESRPTTVPTGVQTVYSPIAEKDAIVHHPKLLADALAGLG